MSVILNNIKYTSRPSRIPFVHPAVLSDTKIINEYTISLTGLGDASGGTVSSFIYIGSNKICNRQREEYHIITNISSYQPTGSNFSIMSQPLFWYNFYDHQSSIPNITIYSAPITYLNYYGRDDTNIIYLGKQYHLQDAQLIPYWASNNNGERYNLLINGIIIDNPLPLTIKSWL